MKAQFVNIFMIFVYAGMNLYPYVHICFLIDHAVPVLYRKSLKVVLGLLMTALSLLIVVKPSSADSVAVNFLRIGNAWAGFLIENNFVLFVFDLCLLIKRLITHRTLAHPLLCGILVIVCSLALTLQGILSSSELHVREYEIAVDKKAAVKDMTIVLAADMHMGYSIGEERIAKMVEIINEQNPDVVILAGDLFDNNFDSLDDPARLAEEFRKIRTKYGVYAAWGNHDVTANLVGGFTYGGSRLRDPRMRSFLQEANITLLDDRIVKIADDSVYLAGRNDEEEPAQEGREDLSELLENVDTNMPLFVINHEPTNLEEYEESGVDLLLSGHTHAGQTFPLSLVMPFLYENSDGYLKKGNLNSFVTSGVGIYGPDMRTFTTPEVMKISCRFGKK